MSGEITKLNPDSHALRTADALLRCSGGTAAYLQMPVQPGDAADTGQLGIDEPSYQQMPLSPVTLRLERRIMTEGQPQRYELLVSGSAVQAVVGELQVASAELLFQMAAGVVVAGELFLIESVSISECMGLIYMYRLLLRESTSGWPMQTAQS